MENKKLNVKMIYTVIGIAALATALVCVVVLAQSLVTKYYQTTILTKFVIKK